MYTAIVNELVEGHAHASGLVTDFNPDAKLVAAPKYADGQLTRTLIKTSWKFKRNGNFSVCSRLLGVIADGTKSRRQRCH